MENEQLMAILNEVLEEQKKIGAIYTERLKLQSQLNKYSDLIEQFTTSIIEENLKGKKSNEKSNEK